MSLVFEYTLTLSQKQKRVSNLQVAEDGFQDGDVHVCPNC